MNRRDFLKLTLGAAGMAAMPGIVNAAPPLPPLKFVIDGFLPSGGMLSIGGAPKAGKSLLAADLAILLAGAKGKFLEQFPMLEHGPVLHIGSMPSSSTHLRFERISASRGTPLFEKLPHTILFGRGFRMNLASEHVWRSLIFSEMRKFGVKYLIIDPIENYGGHKALVALDDYFKGWNPRPAIFFTYNYNSAPLPDHAVATERGRHMYWRYERGSSILGDWGDTHINVRKIVHHGIVDGERVGFADGTSLISVETRHIPDPKPTIMKLNGKSLRFMQL